MAHGYNNYGRADAEGMKINPNTNTNPVRMDGATLPQRPVAAQMAAAEASAFAGSTAVNQALQSTPDSRSAAVERARALVNDPEYPSAAMVKQISQLLADKIGGSGE